MRIPAMAILSAATVLTAAPTQAQTYNPDYPVCLQVYGKEGGYIGCGYTSMAQCAQSASGLAAQCIINPYFAGAQRPAGPHYRRYRQLHHRRFSRALLIDLIEIASIGTTMNLG